ncbi:MAG TPA: hypothetical protein VGG49_13305 [Steroidobacteraceae bacterium]|jgi:hypothetical protein
MPLAEILILVQIAAGLAGTANGLIQIIESVKKDPSLDPVEELKAAIKAAATPKAMTALWGISSVLHDKAVEIIQGSPAAAPAAAVTQGGAAP